MEALWKPTTLLRPINAVLGQLAAVTRTEALTGSAKTTVTTLFLVGCPGDTGRAMSQENVEIVGRAITALNKRDIEDYLACCTEDVTLRTPIAAVAGVHEGPEGIRRFFSDIEDAGPDFRIEIERVEAFSDERVLAFVRVTATGRASGVPTEIETANVYEFSEGRIRRIDVYTDRQEALEAVGVRE
jgi:ketosteroid isomerase-like protein